MAQQTQAPPPVIPPEVQRFAAEQGVADCLPSVVEMTQHVFPEARRLAVALEEDWEIAEDRHIVLEVRVGNLEVPQALEARYRWHRGLFACCPAPQVSVFRLGLGSAG
jgi:hypothetical protein